MAEKWRELLAEARRVSTMRAISLEAAFDRLTVELNRAMPPAVASLPVPEQQPLNEYRIGD